MGAWFLWGHRFRGMDYGVMGWLLPGACVCKDGEGNCLPTMPVIKYTVCNMR